MRVTLFRFKLYFVVPMLMAGIYACGASGDESEQHVGKAAHAESVLAWRSDRLSRLKAPGGYLNLAGLYWLVDGSSSFGSGDINDIVFPTGATRIGEFVTAEGGVQMSIAGSVDVRVNDERVTSIFMPDDLGEDVVTATHGTLAWTVINREGKYAVRLRDLAHPVLDAFPPIPYYDIQNRWRVEGTLRYFDEPRVMNVDTVIEGLGWNPESPGVVEFEVDGTPYSLEAYQSGERLFFVFGDRTSGRETYPAGRFLYAEMPGDDGTTVLDFNRAYNPPCAFNDFSTCPIASPRNRLPVAVDAGEKYDAALFVGSKY